MNQQPIPQSPNLVGRRIAAIGAGLAITFGAVACSDTSESTPSIDYVVGQDNSGTTPEGGTTTTGPESADGSYEDLMSRLEAAGYSRELAEEILGMGEMPLNNPEACLTFVADAKGGEAQAKNGGWLIATGGELVINTDMFVTAGEGIVENDGPNHFTDSVADDFMEGDQMLATEVTDYFGDPVSVEERTREAVQELFANFCGDGYELASGQVATANARIGNTDVRLGEIFKGALGQYVIEGEVTPESMTEMVQSALSNYVIEYPEGIDTQDERDAYLVENPEEAEKRIEAYNKQLEDASKLISVLLNFLPTLNRDTTHVNVSSQVYGTNESNYPELIFSDESIDATGEPHGLGGEYDAIPASLVSFLGKFKAGCVNIEGGALVFNLLDGRAGYSNVLVNAPEVCEPVVITVPPTIPGRSNPTTTRPEIRLTPDSSVIAGPGVGGEPDYDNNPDNNATTSLVDEQPTTTQEVPETTITVEGDDEDNGEIIVP